MDTKTRYRKRLQLQAALTRVMKVRLQHKDEGIPPDRTTALMAAQVCTALWLYMVDTGLTPEQMKPKKLDLSRFATLDAMRKKQTESTKRSRKKGTEKQATNEDTPGK